MVLIFDIFSDYGHFKKPYTTTSPLTFSFPTRTAVCGIIGAIIGLDKEEYNDYFSREDAQIAIGIEKKIKKVRMGQNLIITEGKFGIIKSAKPTRIEYLKDSKFRIYFKHKDNEIYTRLKECLAEHCSYYTVSMGLSENLMNFEYIGEYNEEFINGTEEEVLINSVISLNNINPNNVQFEMDKEYFTENMPIEMTKERIVTEYGEILYERQGKQIKLVNSNYINIKMKDLSENIIFI